MTLTLFKPFTNAEPGSLGELFEVAVFCYCFLSIFLVPILWYEWHGIDDRNRLRRYLTLLSVPFVWPIAVLVWAAKALAHYVDQDLRRELRDLAPKRKAAHVLKSPRELGLWD